MFDYTLYGRGEVADEKRLPGSEESDVAVNPRIYVVVLFIIGAEEGIGVTYRFGCHPIEVVDGDSRIYQYLLLAFV